jgi:hypothetical protein
VPGRAQRDDEQSACIAAVARVCEQAFVDLEAALERIDSWIEEAEVQGATARTSVLCALSLQLVVSDFADLTPLRRWSDKLAQSPLDPAALETHAALIYCAGVVAAHQFSGAQASSAAALPPLQVAAEHYRVRLLHEHAHIHANVLVSTAEPLVGWWGTTGESGTVDEISLLVGRRLDDAALSGHIRSRWLFWVGCACMQVDQRALA